MNSLSACVDGIGVLGPGLSDWSAACSVLAGITPYDPRPTVLPMPDSLPPAERRRTGRIVRLALAVGLEATSRAAVHPSHLPTVFSSSGGDGENCHEICQALASADRQLSPTRFHNSVHNVAAGYWSIANGARAPSNTLCVFDASFSGGLLEALSQVAVDRTACLLIAYDSQYPQPLFAQRPIPDAFGVALLLSAEARPTSLGRLTATLCDSPPDRLAQPNLESLRLAVPAARSLPLLQALALRAPRDVTARERQTVVLEYLADLRLAVEVAPCN
jgi:hypothetical protein